MHILAAHWYESSLSQTLHTLVNVRTTPRKKGKKMRVYPYNPGQSSEIFTHFPCLFQDVSGQGHPMAQSHPRLWHHLQPPTHRTLRPTPGVSAAVLWWERPSLPRSCAYASRCLTCPMLRPPAGTRLAEHVSHIIIDQDADTN